MSEDKRKVICFGEILWDVFPDGKRLGGAPFNLAFRVSSLGDRALMISRVGRDELGEQALAEARELGLDISLIQRDESRPTGTVEVTFDDSGKHDFEIIRDVAYDCIEQSEEALREIGDCDYLCFGTLAQRKEKSRRSLAAMIGAAGDARLFLDINLRKDCYTPETVRSSLERADVLKLNEDEAAELAEMLFDSECPVPEFCDRVIDAFGLRRCLVSLGEAGVFGASSEGGKVYVPGHDVEVADTVGSGDAFSAGYVHTDIRGGSLADCCEFGNLMGALAATKQGGTASISRGEMESMPHSTGRIVNSDYERWMA